MTSISGQLGTMVAAVVLVAAGCQSANEPLPHRASGAEGQAELQQRLKPTYRAKRPASPAPYPAILFVSGCTGFSHPRMPSLYTSRAEQLVETGYVVAYVDYLAAHGIENACEGPQNIKGESITVEEIGEYVLAAARDFQREPDIYADRIFAVGWSLGGGGALAALSLSQGDSFPLRAVAALYPVCRGVPKWEISTPVLLLLAGIDNIQPPELCQDLVAVLPGGTRPTVRAYARAHHGFDAEELPVVTAPETGPTLAHNPDAAVAAWKEIQALLK